VTLGQPSALDGPFPGGREGATVVLHPLLCAEQISPPEIMAMTRGRLRTSLAFFGSKRDWIRVPIVAFLVEHPTAGPFLIDTGFHPSVAVDPKQSLGPVLGRLWNLDMRPEQAVPAQLRERGIDHRDLPLVVMTHLHLDHASGISEFPNATFVLGGGEWAGMHGPRPTMNGYVRKHVAHAVEFREVDYDGPSIASHSTFARSFDLFGDGSVQLLFTPGHTLGHQSVLLRLKDREALVCGDAIYYLATLDDERRGWAMADEHLWRRSLREIQLYRRETPGALIVPGHDAGAWERLADRYE
jgi:glyoxylase-like metal-dependent hydrolase (beta-lactamase superfamily II)